MTHFVKLTDENYSVYGFYECGDESEILDCLNDTKMYTLSDEAYEYCMSNNSRFYTVVTDDLIKRFNDFDANKDKYIEDVESLPTVIQVSDFSINKIHNIKNVIWNKQRKNKIWCDEAIEFGIVITLNGERVRIPYAISNQVDMEEKIRLVKSGVLNDSTLIPILGADQEEFIFVDVATFTDIYKKLFYNKYYNLFYLRILNKYIASVEDIDTIERMSYEVRLPEEYLKKLYDLLEPYNAYRKGKEL